jgi:hypothetical protein
MKIPAGMRPDARSLGLALLLVVSSGTNAMGSEAPSPHAWSVMGGAGVGLGLATSGVSSAMREGGYDDPEPCIWCSGPPRSTPYSRYAGLSWELEAFRPFGDTAWIGGLLARDLLAETHGYKAASSGGFMFLRQSVIAGAVLLGGGGGRVRATEHGFYWGGGPSLLRLGLEHEDSPGGHSVWATTLGAVGEVGWVAIVSGRMFSEVRCRACVVPTVSMGPVPRSLGGGPEGSLPRTRVNFTHVLLGVSLGRRF